MGTSDERIGLRFDTVADRYHAVRPRYPDAMWDTLFAATGLQPGGRVLEIGAGTGIATAELVRRGCHVTALEPGPAMAAIIERDLKATGLVDVRVGRFDEFSWAGEPFDLVFGATSLHWIDRALLHRRLRHLVRPNGFAALLHYLHVAGGDQRFFEAAQRCYARWDPDYQEYHLPPSERRIDDTRLLDGLPGFDPALDRYWLVDIPSGRDHYLALVSTYSTTLRIPEPNRSHLLDCIGDLMDAEFGGEITKRYRFDLVIMQRIAE